MNQENEENMSIQSDSLLKNLGNVKNLTSWGRHMVAFCGQGFKGGFKFIPFGTL